VLSRSSEYAIRALTYLARQNDQRHHLARDMAERLGIPAPFLGKVLQPLVTRGILHSQRGRSGGFRLARQANDIPLVQIVEAEETLGPAEVCLLGQHECSDEHACPMHDYWKKASSAFHERLRRTTLNDLVTHCDAHGECLYPYQGARIAPMVMRASEPMLHISEPQHISEPAVSA
jgi:Rrf2 family protein